MTGSPDSISRPNVRAQKRDRALNWKDRGNRRYDTVAYGNYDALASREVGGKYFIEWREKHYSEDRCEWFEVRAYNVCYQDKAAAGLVAFASSISARLTRRRRSPNCTIKSTATCSANT